MIRKLTPEQQKIIDIAGKHYGVAYLLMTIAIDHVDAGDIEVKKLGLFRQEIKMLSSRVQSAFDAFCKDFQRYIGKGDDKVILRDWENLTEKINGILDIEK